MPITTSGAQSAVAQNAALIQAQAQQSDAASATSASPSTAAVYPLASMPPIRDPSASDPLLGIASAAQKAEAQGSAGTAVAQALMSESAQVLSAYQTALGSWTAS